MKVALARVDNRLVHGQILEAWLPYTKAACIAVVDDIAASDLFHTSVIRMAVPQDIDVIVSSVADFARMHSYEAGGQHASIVLFRNIATSFQAFNFGFRFTSLNIGNSYAESCARQLAMSVRLSEEDIRHLEALLAAGVNIDLRRLPGEKPVDIRTLIDKHRA